MDYQKKTPVTSIFDLIDKGVGSDVLARAEDTAIAYLKEFEDEAMEYIRNAHKYQGVSTGYKGMDSLMGSFLPGELFTIGGDTGHGKSLLAMNIAQNVYDKRQEPVLLVNLELTRNQAVQRFYNLSGEDHDYAGIMIQRAPAVRYKDIDILMQKAKDEGVCLVVIDHLHFFSRSAENEARELSRIMKHFKECAVLHELPVILLSHVTPTRVMDHEGNVKKTYKPSLHNFKGSSSIEQDSDMVGFVFREDGENRMDFYMRKNRSRPLNPQATHFIQTEWKLKEDELWLPTNLPPSGESYEPTQSPSSPNETAVKSLTQSHLDVASLKT
jgi:replicative DNA helicase